MQRNSAMRQKEKIPIYTVPLAGLKASGKSKSPKSRPMKFSKSPLRKSSGADSFFSPKIVKEADYGNSSGVRLTEDTGAGGVYQLGFSE
jgi:hypothetical protein